MEQNYQRSVSDSNYATRSPHFKDNEAMKERSTASEGAVRPPARKGSDSARHRAQRRRTRAQNEGGENGETNSCDRDDLTASSGSGSGSTQSHDSSAEWCTVTHKKNHSPRTESTDSRRTFDQSSDKRPFDEGRGTRGGHYGRGNRGRGDRGRGSGGPRGRGRGGKG